jgi:ABC-type dipeptide/oligopeptide/nickel transport system permease component
VRGLDFVAKRIGFALVTVLAAVTLNFVLFRAIPGDAVQALRCQHCTIQFKNALRKELGLDKSKWEQYKRYLVDLAHGDLGSSVRSQQPVWDELWPSIKNTMPMIALGTCLRSFSGRSWG